MHQPVLPSCTILEVMPNMILLIVHQAIVNPLQGLLNCVVYGRHLLFRHIGRPTERDTSDWNADSEDPVSETTPILFRSGSYS